MLYKIKPLIWHKNCADAGAIGLYHIISSFSSGILGWLSPPNYEYHFCDDIKKVKEECQQHYENLLKKNLMEQNEIILNEDYWDCNCVENYIHPIYENYCSKCDTYEEDMPNSRQNEINEFGIRNKVTSWLKYPENIPTSQDKCIVIIEYQGDLGLSRYLWCAWHDGEKFRDYAEDNDLSRGAKVKYFIEEKNLNIPKKGGDN